MKRTILPTLLCLAVGLVLGRTAVQAADKIDVLLITGDDVTPAHDWTTVAPETRKILEDSGRFKVVISEDAGILDSTRSLARYDVIMLAMYNAKTPTISDQAKENLLEFVKGGKGFVVAHLASASFKEWDEFGNLCGRRWVMGTSGHGPRSPFEVKVATGTHPITRGMKGFTADDELYAKMQGEAPIRVLLTAASDWSHRTEPMAFVLDYGEGRVFHHTFGHDVKALQTPEVRELIARGTEWAATGSVR
jgi:type 1 glutamine amidotransferase